MTIDTSGLAFPKPSASKLTLSKADRAAKLNALCVAQRMRCAACKKPMTRTPDLLNTATLDHKRPQPMGCKKDDSDQNLRAVCWQCNFEKGSKR